MGAGGELTLHPSQGLLERCTPCPFREGMAVAMPWQQPGHIQIQQSFHRLNLALKIPPAVAL